MVELLVTIAIIVVLGALSFVALGRIRESARAAVCLNNIKQVTATHILLAQENGGNLVHPWTSTIHGSEQRNWSEFHTILLNEDFGWDEPALRSPPGCVIWINSAAPPPTPARDPE